MPSKKFAPGATLPRGDSRHGTLNGYTHHKCRCDLCRGAWAAYHAQFRAEKFEGVPCRMKKCKRQASKAAGNGLCDPHNERLQELRALELRQKRARKRRRRAVAA